VHPELTLNVIGPFLERVPRYRLGTLVVGRRVAVDLLVANHTLVPTQTDIRVRTATADGLRLEGDVEAMLPLLAPGQVHRLPLVWQAIKTCDRGKLIVTVEWGDTTRSVVLHFDGCVQPGESVIRGAVIRRYPGARRAAFAWRGDMDLYDTSTLQTVEGLKTTLDLAARYRVPQTMYLSTRLTLDEDSAKAWASHFGIERGAGHIPRFKDWIQRNVDLCHRADYPFESSKPFLIELGNHGHLHFGDDSAAAAGNRWTVKAKIGAGKYAWLGDDHSSFGEQRDNALEARRWIEESFGFTPKSWAMPDRTRDDFTPAAMEAAGCEVLSDSDARAVHNVLLQPPPHFPRGCSSVELTKRYPGDPQHVFHYAMILFWIHRARRLGIPVVFMCHQHMRQFDGVACSRFTEALLRHVIANMNGDLWIDTVYGVGTYWRDVLSEERRVVGVQIDGDDVWLTSEGPLDHLGIPVDVTFSSGGRATYLVDLPAGEKAGFSIA
jgi:hypothetical protein